MAKNVVVMVDGTGKGLEPNGSNVLRLARVLWADGAQQVSYYDPGVGTQGAPVAGSLSRQELVKVMGLAIGSGVYEKIGVAYRYLMAHYEPGDRIYLFGFSRGAYVVRALAGLIGKLGILARGRDNLVPYVIKIYAHPTNLRLSHEFGQTFSDRHPDIRFLGLWDTVKSLFQVERYGREIRSVALPRTYSNPAVRIVRHALAIDERRRFFRTNRWLEGQGADPATDCKQVWFAGDHSDVGGGYPEPESGLSKITFAWMLKEAKAAGLLVDPDREARLLGYKGPDRRVARPDPLAPVHNSLDGWWHVPEWVPKVSRGGPDMRAPKRTRVYIPLGEPRFIPHGALLHQSVVERLEARVGYAPPNLPKFFRVEAA